MIVVEEVPPGDPAAQTLLGEWKPEMDLSTSGDRHLYLIARIDDEPVAVLEGTHDYTGWQHLEDYHHLGEEDLGSYISSLYVKPSHRRRGIADALLDWFIDDARRQGSIAVVAWPDEDDLGRDARVALNRKHGLEFGRVHEGFQEPWLMVLPLR
ncbi:Acetyltransferase (GNAT) family protein [Nocardioides sp. YR527]|uniref:GNAT family N-acetyltransferase n=1 Tax=Nocardioides sp. YR527 TaxID=1881028 RepID=UPI0008863424|nr:GNAT family N-acetyltransferase [Nocardioides sp. YR527]SDL33821.1 Acetyltransferase (GNAT) family protein [Nocardioides sp. YR527]